jgi:hypothetical protein
MVLVAPQQSQYILILPDPAPAIRMACGNEGEDNVRHTFWLTCGLLASVLAIWGIARGDEGPPAWAYAVNPPGVIPPPDDGTPRHVPDGAAGFTLTQIRDLFFSPDWHPEDH